MASWGELQETFVEIKKSLNREYLHGFEPTTTQQIWPSHVPDPHAKPLMELMDNFRTLQARDMRDKANALRSLATDGADLPVDYGKPVLHIFFDILSLSASSTIPPSPEDAYVQIDPELYHILKDARRLIRCFPLSERDIRPLLTSGAAASFDLRKMQPGEEIRLCTWMSAEYVYDSRPYRDHLCRTPTNISMHS